jgi:hypothetical protein
MARKHCRPQLLKKNISVSLTLPTNTANRGEKMSTTPPTADPSMNKKKLTERHSSDPHRRRSGLCSRDGFQKLIAAGGLLTRIRGPQNRARNEGNADVSTGSAAFGIERAGWPSCC